jgi:hypothetical protein
MGQRDGLRQAVSAPAEDSQLMKRVWGHSPLKLSPRYGLLAIAVRAAHGL